MPLCKHFDEVRAKKMYLFCRTDGIAREKQNLFMLFRVMTEEGKANRWNSERKAKLVYAFPSHDRGRQSQCENFI